MSLYQGPGISFDAMRAADVARLREVFKSDIFDTRPLSKIRSYEAHPPEQWTIELSGCCIEDIPAEFLDEIKSYLVARIFRSADKEEMLKWRKIVWPEEKEVNP